MPKKSRLDYSIINSFIGVLTQIITVVIGFFLQSIFIRTLGATYLGIKGLFSNILSVLSFTELGIGIAITFSLYKPLSQKNKSQIAIIMHFFKKAYEVIGIIIGILGLLIIPFIKKMTHVIIPNIYIYYILYLANTVISYFFTYKRTLLYADQKSYINQINEVIFRIIQTVLQLIVLLVFKSFFLFLIIQLLCTVFSNILISIKVNKLYPYILDKNLYKKHSLPKRIKKEIFSNTLGSIGSNIGNIVVNSTDNVLISSFQGLYWVGLYSNYMLVINNLMNIIGQAIGAVTSSIGNLNAENDDREYQYDIFDKCFYINYFCIFVCSICLMTLINIFIDLWVGSRFKFDFILVFALVFNFIIMGLRQTLTTFVGAYGLYQRDGVKAIIESILNLILSIVYITQFRLGVLGIVLGTISSNLLVNWYEPYMILKYGIKIPEKLKNFYIKILFYIFINVIVMLIFAKYVPLIIRVNNFFELIILGVITVILAIAVFILLFGWDKNFKFMVNVIGKMISRKK